MSKHQRINTKILIPVLIVCAIITLILSIGLGPVSVSPITTAKILISRIPFIGTFIPQAWEQLDYNIIIGLRLPRVLLGMVVGASLMSGVTIAISGSIGFVGLMVPHFTRLFVGGDHRKVLPVSALLGGILVVWVDVLARTVIAPEELPVGILTAVIGGPIFIWMLRRKQR